jgi:hypothetical protein
MQEPFAPKITLESISGYAQTAGLALDDAQLAELAPIISSQLAKVATLWAVDVSSYELSVIFSAAAAWGLDDRAEHERT